MFRKVLTRKALVIKRVGWWPTSLS